MTRELASAGPAVGSQLEESDLTISWYMYHIKALVALLNEDINQYGPGWREASEQRAAQSHRELRSISMFILLSRAAGAGDHRLRRVYIYRNLGSEPDRHLAGDVAALAQGEPNVSVPALQRRDELGSWRGPLTFSPAIWRRWSTPPGCWKRGRPTRWRSIGLSAPGAGGGAACMSQKDEGRRPADRRSGA